MRIWMRNRIQVFFSSTRIRIWAVGVINENRNEIANWSKTMLTLIFFFFSFPLPNQYPDYYFSKFSFCFQYNLQVNFKINTVNVN